jgi:uroporphyrinogen decarboxylase
LKYNPLLRDEVRNVIDGKGAASRVPVILHFWNDPSSFGEQSEYVRSFINEFPMDINAFGVNFPDVFNAPIDDPEYRWLSYDKPTDIKDSNAYDSNNFLYDWSLIDDIVEKFPKFSYKNLLPAKFETSKYNLCCWWFCFFERHWSLRGMENALTDFYLFPEEVHKLYRALTDFYKGVIVRAKKESNADGVFTSDDIGMQTGTFFSLKIFREFFKPYYKELVETAHENGMHFWLHTCGNVKDFMPEFIEIGLDVIHPIQKYTMDEIEIAQKYGDKICIWAGFDVQQTIPYKTAEEVRAEVRFMMDTYYRKEGRFMITAGNGITGDCPVKSLEALYEECFDYGSKIGK